MKRKILVVGMVCFIMLTSCDKQSKKDIDYNSDLAKNNVVVEDVSSNTSSDAKPYRDGEVEKKGEYDFCYDIDGSNISVRANISRKANAKYPKVKVSLKEYTEDDIKQIADSFFDEGKYEMYLDPSQGNENYALNREHRLQAYLSEYMGNEPEWINDERIMLGDFVENYKEYNNDISINYDVENDIKYYTMNDNNIMGLAGIEYCYLEGKRNGELYKMKFAKKDGRMYVECYKPVLSENTKIVGSESSVNDMDIDSFKEDSNLMSYDDAEKQAYDVIKQFGFDGYDVYDVSTTIYVKQGISINDSDIVDEGGFDKAFKFYFARNYAGEYKEYTMENAHYGGDLQGALIDDDSGWSAPYSKHNDEECITVIISESGFCELQIMNPMNLDEVMEEESKLLDIEEINNIARTRIAERDFETLVNEIEVTDIKLGYGQIYKDGKIMMVPVWNYMYIPMGELGNISLFPRSLITTNAIDGSIIGEDMTENLTKDK